MFAAGGAGILPINTGAYAHTPALTDILHTVHIVSLSAFPRVCVIACVLCLAGVVGSCWHIICSAKRKVTQSELIGLGIFLV